MRERLEDKVREESGGSKREPSNWEPLEGDPEGTLRLSDHDLGMRGGLLPQLTGPRPHPSNIHALLFGLPPPKTCFWFCQATHVHFSRLHALALAVPSPKVTAPFSPDELPIRLQDHPLMSSSDVWTVTAPP